MDFNKNVKRFGTECEKFDGAKEYFGGLENVTPLWVADMDFESARCIQKAFGKRVKHNVYGYTKKDGKVIKSIQNWLSNKHSYEVKKEDIFIASGVVTSINIAINAFTDENDGIVIQPPVYHHFAKSIKANHRKMLVNELVLKDGKYEVDFEDLEQKLKDAKMLILCNPQNPTGKVFTKKELKKIGKLCVENDVIIFSDEIHFDIVFAPNKHIPLASLDKKIANQTITATAASKSFNVAGCSTSYLVIENESLRRKYKTTSKRYIADDGNLFGVIATKAAYDGGQIWLEDLMRYLEKNVEFVTSFCKENIPKVKVIKPESTYLMWLDFRDFGKSNDEMKKLLWEDANAGLMDGRVFGEGGDGFFRLNIGTQKRVLKQALKRIANL